MANSGQPLESTARRGRRINVFQLLGLLGTFAALSVIGGLLIGGMVAPLALGTSTVTSSGAALFDDLPSDFEAGKLSQASYIYANDGKTLLATYYWENRIVVDLTDISDNLQNAVVATEDKRFFEHGAVDLVGIPRAFANNLSGSGGTQGASTLTQQYVKNVLIEKAHAAGDDEGVNEATASTYQRKIKEAKLAIAVEKQMTKNEILEGYLNIAQFGTSVYGAEAAARHYFGVSAKDLSVVQAATIAGITQRPAAYDPVLHPDAAEKRRNIVLSLMYQQSYITKAQYEEARATSVADSLNVQAIEQGCVAAKSAAFFCDYVTKVITGDPVFGKTAEDRKNLLYRGGLSIVTTIDMKLQKEATKQLKESIPANESHGIATALSSVEPGTGKILTMAQNRAYDPSESPKKYTTAINYNTDQEHGGSRGFQPGSTFKPFTLTEWLKTGHTLNDRINATSRTYQQSSFKASCTGFGGTWSPGNSEGSRQGMISALTATRLSVNTGFAAMEQELDLCSLADTAYEVGFRPSQTNGEDSTSTYFTDDGVEVTPSMTLGVQNTSPLAQAAAYATFANDGKYCEPIAIVSVKDSAGKKLAVPTANCRRVIPANIANAVTYALQGVIRPGGGAPALALAGGRPGAGKTGTAGNNTHTWFVGYTPQLATAVWVGNPSKDLEMRHISVGGRATQNIYGSTIAGPTWKKYMDFALAKKPKESFPAVDYSLVGQVYVAPTKPADTKDTGTKNTGTKDTTKKPTPPKSTKKP